MDHLYGVHDAWQATSYGGRIAGVQGLAELLQRVKVLDVVPRLIEGVRYAAVQVPPCLRVMWGVERSS